MSSQHINITPKAEAWKFSPKTMLLNKNFEKPLQTTLKEIKNNKIALGHSAQQFQTLSLAELEEDGYITIKETSPLCLSNKHTKKASLDSTLTDLYKNVKPLKITILKPLPSTLWISPHKNLRVVEFNLSDNVHQPICIFEANSLKQHAEGFLFNFNISKGAHLELGVLANISTSSFSQINIQTQKLTKTHVFTLLSGNVDYKRLETNIYQNGVESEVLINGLCFTNNSSTLEFHSNIFHLNNNQNTTQIYKTICSNKGKAIFGGRIHLTEKSSGATVKQLNNNLLLEKNSSVDTQPELNISHDNVKASHGATTSTVDNEHLFYFASRGFKPDQSKKILLKAFCSSSFSNIKNKGLAQYFSDQISTDLKNVK